MATHRVLVIEPSLLSAVPLSTTARHLSSFLAERGNEVLNLKRSISRSPSRLFEEVLRLVKQTDLALILIDDESTVSGFFLALLLSRGKRTLLFSRNQELVDGLKAITLKESYVFHYRKTEEIINTLKLFRI